jgi:hypothetical protein
VTHPFGARLQALMDRKGMTASELAAKIWADVQRDRERTMNPNQGISFEAALTKLKRGERVARAGWNGKGMWIALHNPDGKEGNKMTAPYIFMKTADGKLVPWLCSQTDMLASDWENVD